MQREAGAAASSSAAPSIEEPTRQAIPQQSSLAAGLKQHTPGVLLVLEEAQRETNRWFWRTCPSQVEIRQSHIFTSFWGPLGVPQPKVPSEYDVGLLAILPTLHCIYLPGPKHPRSVWQSSSKIGLITGRQAPSKLGPLCGCGHMAAHLGIKTHR